MKALGNQAAAFRAGLSGKKMPGWCPPGSLVAKSYRKGRTMSKKPYLISNGEWYFKGCFIQLFKHPALFGKYEVFKDDLFQTHVDRYKTFKEAVESCKENEVTNPVNGLLKFI